MSTVAPTPSATSSSSGGPTVPCPGVVEMLKFRHATLRLLGAAYRCCNTFVTTGAPAIASQNKLAQVSDGVDLRPRSLDQYNLLPKTYYSR